MHTADGKRDRKTYFSCSGTRKFPFPFCNAHNMPELDLPVLHEIIRIRATPLHCFASNAQGYRRGDGLLKVCVLAWSLETQALAQDGG